MKKVYVLHVPWLSDEVVEELRQLLEALRLELMLLKADDTDDLQTDDLVLIVIGDAIDEDVEASATIDRVTSHGAQAVGVWPRGQYEGTFPAVLARSGSGVTTCDAKGMRELADATAEGGEVWLDQGGRPIAKRPLKRGGC